MINNDWQKIESAPIGEDVLIYSPDSDVPILVGHMLNGSDEWYPQHESTYHGAPFDVGFTHWMPLPEMPK